MQVIIAFEKENEEKTITRTHFFNFIWTFSLFSRIYLYEKDALIQKVAYVYEDGIESEPLPRYIHLGMFTDSILFGEECQIRFFVYPFSLRLYDTDVDRLEFFNGSDRTVSISCFGKQMILAPGERGKLISTDKKFKHSPQE